MPQPDSEPPLTTGARQRAPGEESAAADWIQRNMTWLVLVGALVLILLPRLSPFQGLNEYLNVFQRLSEWILGRLQALFKDYGYYVVFFGVLAENSVLLGLLVPGTIVLILAGLSAQNGSINLPLVIALGVAAALLGDTISYQIGRMGWTRVLDRFGMSEMIEKVRGPMESNRRWIILAYHFAGYSRAVGPIAAGIFKIPFRKWAPFDYSGATVWVLAYVMIGVVLGISGVKFDDTKRMARLIEIFFTGLLVVALVVTVWRSIRAQERAALVPAAEAEPAVEVSSDER
ncbi:MAG: DedA family protein [Dehalococcoidia bacterium]|nr:DedA family protein [Dehalococcoidia bacterium]